MVITADTLGQARAAFGVALITSFTASWVERTRTYGSLADLAVDFPSGTPEYLAGQSLFSQSPHPEQVMVGRCALPPTAVYQVGVATAAAGGYYSVGVTGYGVTVTTCAYTALANLDFTALNAGDVFSATAHGMTTGNGPYRMSGGSLPTGTAVDTNYWIISLTADTFQVATSKANALATTAMTISSDGSGTLLRANNDTICAQIVQALNAVVGKNFTAAQVTGSGETDYITVTANTAGNYFSLQVDPTFLTSKQTHADPGIATDLAAIALESGAWYALVTTQNSKALVLAAAAWIEAQAKVYLVDVAETDAINTVVLNSTDTLGALFALGYNRTAGSYHPNPGGMFSAAWLGRVLPDEPGSATYKFKTLAGQVPVTLSGTQKVNLRARKANTYETIGSENKTWEGTVAGGSFGFIDTTIGLDWLQDDMSKGVFDALSGPEKIPFTDPGVAVIRAAMKSSLKTAVAMGIITDDFVIQVPKVASISASNKSLRKLPDMKWSAVLAGAIHHVAITGVVSV